MGRLRAGALAADPLGLEKDDGEDLESCCGFDDAELLFDAVREALKAHALNPAEVEVEGNAK